MNNKGWTSTIGLEFHKLGLVSSTLTSVAKHINFLWQSKVPKWWMAEMKWQIRASIWIYEWHSHHFITAVMLLLSADKL